MKVERKAEHAVSDETCKAATGRTLADWHGLIDGRGGLELGRRKIGDWLAGELKVDPWWSATITHEYELARGAVEKDGKPKGYTICATKTVKADPASCYLSLIHILTLPTPVEIKFAPSGAKTTVMVTIERLQTRAEADGYRRAWGEALERLKQTLE